MLTNMELLILTISVDLFSQPAPSLLLKDLVIQQDDEIRLRIIGTRVDASDIVSSYLQYLSILFPKHTTIIQC